MTIRPASPLTARLHLSPLQLIVHGTIIGYDDFATGGADGEARAHAEMVQKYKLNLRRIATVDGRQMFVVVPSCEGGVKCEYAGGMEYCECTTPSASSPRHANR